MVKHSEIFHRNTGLFIDLVDAEIIYILKKNGSFRDGLYVNEFNEPWRQTVLPKNYFAKNELISYYYDCMINNEFPEGYESNKIVRALNRDFW